MKHIFLFKVLILTSIIAKANIVGPIPVTAMESNPIGGGFAKALVYIDYKSSGQLRKPLIIFEGYDPGYYTKPNAKEGRTGILTFISDINNIETGAANSELLPLLQGANRDYDIIYVNWKNGADYLENNEKVAKAVIKWVNDAKIAVNGVKQPNVIIGRSMGAVIARMALKHMEQAYAANPAQNPPHNTRLFISNDGGMQGSNIPQGYQHMLNHFRNLYIQTGPTMLAIEGSGGFTNFLAENLNFGRRVGTPLMSLSVNESPASRQLAINHINLSNQIDNSLHNSFVASLNALGYPSGDGTTPSPFRMVAASNGSECAKPQDVGSGGNLLTYSGRVSTTFLASLIGGLDGVMTVTGSVAVPYASPPMAILGSLPGRNDFNLDLKVNAKADNVANQLYKGTISYTKKILGFIPVTVNITNKSNIATASTLAYDYFPGGNQDLTSEMPFPQSGSTLLLEKNITFSHQAYCHIPVPSALDIGKGTQTLTYADYFTPYKGASPPPPPKNTAFTDGFITAFNSSSDNEGHTQITRRNGDWMAAELNGSPAIATNCASLCNPVIGGSDFFCTSPSGMYTLPSLPGNSSVLWSTQPSSIATPNTPTAIQTTLSKNGNGSIDLTATITNNGCGGLVNIKKLAINVGAPITTCQEIGNGACNQTNFICPAQLNNWQYVNLFGTWGAGGTGYHLQVNGGGYFNNGLTTQDITTNYFSVYVPSGGNNVTIRARNSCGVSQNTPYVIIYSPKSYGCTGLFQVDPNPASKTITVSPVADAATATASKQVNAIAASFTKVEIFDKMGNLKKQFKFAKGTKHATIDISSLPADAYVVKVFNGTTWEENKLLVVR